MSKKTDKPWERQPGESEKAYEAFALYRDLGLNRSNHEVCSKLSKSRQLISRWKANYHWDERVRAYDNDLQKQAHAAAVKDLKEMTARHVKISMQLQKKALQALSGLKPEDMSPKDVKEFIKLSTELERLNRMNSASDDLEGDGPADNAAKIWATKLMEQWEVEDEE